MDTRACQVLLLSSGHSSSQYKRLPIYKCPGVLGVTSEDCPGVVWGVGDALGFGRGGKMSADMLDQAVGERMPGVRPDIGLCLETRGNGESLRSSSS